MTSFTLAGSMLHVIAIHESSSRVIACVNKEWAQAVNVVISELRRRFLSSDFTVHCLGLATLNESMAERRLERVVRVRVRNHDITDLGLWWYRTQLYLHYAISRRCNMSVQRILRRCYVFSGYSGYDVGIFKDVYRYRTSKNLDEPLEARLFCKSGYVQARDLGCANLGRSIDEVLQTLICAKEGTIYCPHMCGCADDLQMQLLGDA